MSGKLIDTEGAQGSLWLEVHTVTQAEDDAGALTIKTRFNRITGYVVVAYNSSGRKLADTFDYSTAGGVLTIDDGTNAPAVNDVIHCTIWGEGGR